MISLGITRRLWLETKIAGAEAAEGAGAEAAEGNLKWTTLGVGFFSNCQSLRCDFLDIANIGVVFL